MLLRPRDKQTGLTLVELLVTLAVATIVLAAGVVGFRGLVAQTRMSNAANSLIGHLQLARSEAIKRGVPVAVCPSSDGKTCLAGDPVIWTHGYIVVAMDRCTGGSSCVDADGDGLADDLLIRHVDGEEMRSLNVDSAQRRRFVFQSDGAAPGFNGTIKICDPGDASDIRLVVVSQTGRTRAACGDASYTCPESCP